MLLSLFKVHGHSMEPTFREGQRLLVSSFPFLFQKPKVGDVVVVKDPRGSRLLLKRITDIRPRRSVALGPTRSTHEYFVAGDNPKASTDSRTFGPVFRKQILGKIIFSIDKSA